MKNIIFDFGCVLVGLDKQRCVNAFRAIGAGDVAVYVDECRQEDLFHDLETGKTDVAEFCDEVRRKSHLCHATDSEICHAWNMLLTGIPTERLQRLLQLRDSYRLFVLSNTNPIHWHKAVDEFFPYRGYGVDDYFERVFLSYRMHLVKPEPEIYLRLISETGIRPDETLFIDDSEANCSAAAALGLNVFHSPTGEEWIDGLADKLENEQLTASL